MTDRHWLAWGIIFVVLVTAVTTWLDHKFGDGTTDKVVNVTLVSTIVVGAIFVVAWAVWTVYGGGA